MGFDILPHRERMVKEDLEEKCDGVSATVWGNGVSVQILTEFPQLTSSTFHPGKKSGSTGGSRENGE